MLYNEDDNFCDQYNDVNESVEAINKQEQIVWSNSWDLEGQFNVQIRSDYLAVKTQKYNEKQPAI